MMSWICQKLCMCCPVHLKTKDFILRFISVDLEIRGHHGYLGHRHRYDNFASCSLCVCW